MNPNQFSKCEKNADLIIPHLYLGNETASKDIKFIKNNKIKAIVNATSTIKNKFEKSKNIKIDYYQIKMNDPGPTFSIDQSDNKIFMENINQALEFIRRHILRGDNVLVHCHAGMMRSASIVLCYLMKYHFLDYDVMRRLSLCVYLLLDKRPCVFYYGKYSSFTPAISEYISQNI